MTPRLPNRHSAALLVVITMVCVVIAIWLFPKAQPTIALKQELTRDSAIELARAFASAHQLPVNDTRVAVRFEQHAETQTFIELEAGGKPAVNAEVNRGDVSLFTWEVRFFRSGDPREVRITLAPGGRVLGFQNILADADARPALDSTQAMARADSVRTSWLALSGPAWRPISTSVKTVQPSGRLDRTLTWERTDRKLGAAPLRIDIVVRGDRAGGARQYVKVPEPFLRRYAERRADNDLYALIATLFVPLFAVLGIAALIGARKRGVVRWRPALIAGGVIGVALALALLNGIPGSYFRYDTAVSPTTFLAQQWLLAVMAGAGMAIVSAVLLATGELLTREAFPEHFDWWRTGRDAGTRPVALRILGGYTLAAFGLAYVSVFYLAVERGLGWWSPSGLLDDPNQIATPFPWLTAVATSLQAGVLEEVLFRAIPIALVARAVGNRPWRPYAMGASVILTALVFGFAHANYPSFPAYARGVELFAEAVLWAVLYIRVGLVTTIIGHFTYDLILFGLFAAAGDALPYRATLAVVVLVGLVPAMLVLSKAWRTRGLMPDAPDDARFGAWRPLARQVTAETTLPTTTRLAPRVRVGVVTLLLGVAASVLALWPTAQPGTPRFTTTGADVAATADSILRTLGATPDGWTRLINASAVTWAKERRFLTEYDSSGQLASRMSRVWLHSAQWDVRYVHPSGTVAQRTESWNVALGPDGQPHTWAHIIADSVATPSLARADAEAAARAALATAGALSSALVLLSAEETARPARRDVTFEFADTSIRMPGTASLRRTATVSGDQVTRIGHRVFLPEAWERADAARSSTRGTIALSAGLVLVVAGIVGLVRFMKRQPLVPAMVWPPRRIMIAVVCTAAIGIVVLGANDWPAKMHGWDTTSPFNRHQWTSALTLLGSAVGPVALWGLWLAADTVRRRAGVDIRSPRATDAWVLGSALALGPVTLSTLPALFRPRSVVSLDTTLDQVIPVLGRFVDGTSGALFVLPLSALVAAAFLSVRSTTGRMIVIGLAAIGYGVVTGESGAVSTAEWVTSMVVAAGAFGLCALVLWRLGNSSLEAWFVGALFIEILSELQDATVAAASADQLSHVLSALLAVAVGVFVTSRPRGA